MKIKVLIDNMPHPEKQSLEAEHGLSFYIETGNEKIMLDVGVSEKFMLNARSLGIDIADVDTLILSHAHKDHTGGLACFLQNNSKAKVYVSANVNGSGYYSNRRKDMRNISIDYGLLMANRERFELVAGNIRLSPTVSIIGKIPVIHGLPKADRTLFAGDVPDTFNHEIALLIAEGNKTVLMSSCTHLGLLNTLKVCAPGEPSVFFGGLHLVDSDDDNQFESDADYVSMAEMICSRYPELQIYTGHCTGNNAKCILKSLLPGQFHVFHTGYEWESLI